MVATKQSPPAPVWSPGPGWYAGPRWRQRYWDGSRWTDRSRIYRNKALVVGIVAFGVGVLFLAACIGLALVLSAANTERFYDPHAEDEKALILLGLFLGVPAVVAGVATTLVGLGIGVRDRRRPRKPRVPPPSSLA